MYENEKAQAEADFVRRFRWNSEDCAILQARDESEAAPCAWCTWEVENANNPRTVIQAGVNRQYDYEDEASGGSPLCEEHTSEMAWEYRGVAPEWVTQVALDAWNGIGQASEAGWKCLWFLFAPEGTYAKDGVWPYEYEGAQQA